MAILPRTVASYLPPLLLMGAIFVLSAQPGLNSGLGSWDTVLRKIAHMLEYGALWWLWWRALGRCSPLPAVLIALAYAASDELHQSFVDGRVGSPVDWAIDAAGVGVAGLIVIARSRSRATPAEPDRTRSPAGAGGEPRI